MAEQSCTAPAAGAGERRYPVPETSSATDPRFWGVTTRVADEFTARGYPALSDEDWLALRAALVRFLYGEQSGGERR